MGRLKKLLEVYKCLSLTAIVTLLALLYIHRPMPVAPVTVGQLRSKQAEYNQIPVVFVRDGTIDVGNNRPIDVEVKNIWPIEVSVRR